MIWRFGPSILLSSLLALLHLLLFLKLDLLLVSLLRIFITLCGLHLNLVLILLVIRHYLALLLDTSSAWVAPLVHPIRRMWCLCQIWLVWLSSICILFLSGIGTLIRYFTLTLISLVFIWFSHGVFWGMVFGRFWVVHTVTNVATWCWLSRDIRLFQRDLPLIHASNLVLRRRLLLFGIVKAISLDLLCLNLQFLVVFSSASYLLLLLLLPSLYILDLLVLSVAIILLSLTILLAHVCHVIWLETQRVVAVDHAVWLI